MNTLPEVKSYLENRLRELDEQKLRYEQKIEIMEKQNK